MGKMIGSVLLVLFIAGSAALIFGRLPLAMGEEAAEVHKEDVFDGGKMKELEMDTSASDILVKRGEDEEVKVQLTGYAANIDDYVYRVDLSEGRLGIKLNKKRWLGFSLDFLDRGYMEVSITLPEQTFDSLKLNSSSASVDLEQINTSTLYVDTSSGDVFMKNVQVKEDMKVRTSSGEVALNHVQGHVAKFHTSSGGVSGRDVGFNDTKVETSSGDVTFHGRILSGDLSVHTSSGHVRVSFDEEPSSFAVDYESSSGEPIIEVSGIEYEKRADHEVKGKKGKGTPLLQVETSSGDFSMD